MCQQRNSIGPSVTSSLNLLEQLGPGQSAGPHSSSHQLIANVPNSVVMHHSYNSMSTYNASLAASHQHPTTITVPPAARNDNHTLVNNTAPFQTKAVFPRTTASAPSTTILLDTVTPLSSPFSTSTSSTAPQAITLLNDNHYHHHQPQPQPQVTLSLTTHAATSLISAQNYYVNKPTFPFKLHDMLSQPQYADIITWAPHGKCWRVMKPKALEKILPIFFRHGKYPSFQRQLYIWRFQRIRSGKDMNSYYHEYFLRDEPTLASMMDRKKENSASNTSSSSSEQQTSSSSSSSSSSSKRKATTSSSASSCPATSPDLRRIQSMSSVSSSSSDNGGCEGCCDSVHKDKEHDDCCQNDDDDMLTSGDNAAAHPEKGSTCSAVDAVAPMLMNVNESAAV